MASMANKLRQATKLSAAALGEDAGIARAVLNRCLCDARGNPLAHWVCELRSWVVWDGKAWRPDPSAARWFDMCRVVATQWEAEAQELKAKAAAAATEEERAKLEAAAKGRLRDAKRISKYSGASAAEKFARTEVSVNISIAHGSPFDQHDLCVNAANGVVDVTRGKLSHHDPALGFTRTLPVPYDARAKCPTFDQMLAEIMPDEETREQLLQWMGCATLGYSPQHIAIWYGRGADGKGTLQRILSALLCEYAAALPEGALTVQQRQEHPTELACLEGARFAYADESEEGGRFNESRVKQLTGGAPVPVRGMRQDYRLARPTWSLTLLTNHLPNVRGYGNAIARRLLFFPFSTRFWLPSDPDFAARPEGAPVGDPAREAVVIDRELPGVLSALVAAAKRFIEGGCKFRPSPKMRDAGLQHRADNDAIFQFFGESCTYPAPGHTIAVGQVIEKLKEFCADAGMLAPSQQAVNAWLYDRGVDRQQCKVGGKSVKVYKNLRWKTDDDAPVSGFRNFHDPGSISKSDLDSNLRNNPGSADFRKPETARKEPRL